MTRRSKRSIEHALEALDGDGSAGQTDPFADVPDDVVDAVRTTSLELLRLIHRNHEVVENADEPAATERYLKLVRDRYGIDDDRDGEVRRGLEDFVDDTWHRSAYDLFANAPLSLGGETELETEDGETLGELVRADRADGAEQLLVRSTYYAFAVHGGRQAKAVA
jgi:hypothetical protein